MQRRIMAGMAASVVAALISTASAAEEKKNCPQSPILELQDRWALAVTWQAAFCETYNTEKKKLPDECPAASEKEIFTLHGLWPQWEEYCVSNLPPEDLAQDPRYLNNTCEIKNREELPKVRLSSSLEQRLREVMPGVKSFLDRYEYFKHGTCSRLNYEEYYDLAVGLTEKLNRTTLPGFLMKHVGGTVSKRQLCDAVEAALGKPARAAVEAQHEFLPGDKSHKRFYLTELRIWLKPVDGKLDLAAENYVEVKSGTKTLGPKPADALCDDNLDKHFYYIDRPGMKR